MNGCDMLYLMAKKKRRGGAENGGGMRAGALKGIGVVLLLALGLFTALAGLGKAGAAGAATFLLLYSFLGIAYILVPIGLFGGVALIVGARVAPQSVPWLKMGGALVFFAAVLGFVGLFYPAHGGRVGVLITRAFVSFLDRAASAVALAALAATGLLVVFETYVSGSPFVRAWNALARFVRPTLPPSPLEEDGAETANVASSDAEYKETSPDTAETEQEPSVRESENEEWEPKRKPRKRFGAYEPPPLTLLERDPEKPNVGDIKANATIIKRTLRNFGIEVEMDEVSIGPSVTRYALKPAEGVKLTAIVARQNDLALALAAHSLRMEAPIPGKSLVGIEIPNTSRATVRLGALLGSAEFSSSDKHLFFALGKSVAGKTHFANLARMPHLLIAGATGSGKSVAIHTLITSLIYRNSPEQLRFIFIDPKRVELTLWSSIPHLMTPVITNAKKAIQTLRWAAKEMDRRYDLLESSSVRDIESYHKNVRTLDPTPYLVIVIDELADIMSLYPRDLEAAVVRLAQMSRAVGIHLVLSTQRPSVNVITGLIKANIPARIALHVASQVDSRTILDMAGAEKLLGMGDMLFLSGERSSPSRIQSAFISEEEVKKVSGYLTDKYPVEMGSELPPHEDGGAPGISGDTALEESDDEVDDELYAAAKEEVERAGKASTSYLQRKLRVGYARAARIMDLLEERGVIGPADGARPREVLSVPPAGDSIRISETLPPEPGGAV